MNGKMYEHEAVQQNLECLRGRGVKLLNLLWENLPVGTKGLGNLHHYTLILDKVENYLRIN